jgi:hypothetical protein
MSLRVVLPFLSPMVGQIDDYQRNIAFDTYNKAVSTILTVQYFRAQGSSKNDVVIRWVES